MLFEGCQGRKNITIDVKKCPQCGNEIEIFSVDSSATCDKCGFVIYNDQLSCVQWCRYARECVGEEMYKKLMQVAADQKARRESQKEDTDQKA